MESAEDRKITVSEETARLIREKVEDGSFASAAEVMSAAMEALRREAEDHAERLASIKARIKASLEDPRPRVPLDEAFDRVRTRLQERMRS